MNKIVENQLAAFFAEANAICGAEKTLHALFCHHLIRGDIDHRTFFREYRVGKSPVDVVLFDGRKPQVAIEFKGGAYGTRNALFDTIDTTGHCRDLDKLKPFADAGISCWFICIDMAELGVALDTTARRQVADQCRKRGIRFAYYCQGEDRYLLDGADKPLPPSHTTPQTTRGTNAGKDMSWVKQFGALCSGIDASEDTYTTWLYHALRESGCGVEQLSLETYFNCANGGSRMQLRPDLTIFDPKVEGRFNLYRHGDYRQPNDGHKLAHLRAVMEVKGSTATAKLSAAAFARQIKADIGKLAQWRTCLCDAHPASQAHDAAYIMLVVDGAKRGADEAYVSALNNEACEAGVKLIYVRG